MATEQNEILDKAKGIWSNYSKMITYTGAAIIILASGWIGYQKLIKEPKELKAAESIFLAEDLFDKMATTGFNKDSVNIVLNGGNFNGSNVTGLLKIINTSAGTLNANRAKYMVGACYLQIGEYDKSIKYLEDFDGSEVDQIQSKAYIMLGHDYAEKKQTEKAMSYYKKAASVNEKDESFTPDALMLCGNYAEAIGKNTEAIDFFKKIKDKYPTFVSVTNGDVDKHLARLGEFE